MDTIFIEGLTLPASIGVHPWEKQVRQPIDIDIQLAMDSANAAMQDTLSEALDYEAVANAIATFIAEHNFALLETLASRLIQYLFSLFPITTITLKVSKRSILIHARSVGVIFERTRAQIEDLR